MAKLDGAAEVAMALHGINEPFVGQSQGMGRQQEIADFARKNRIIAGPGIRITQTEQGQVIEAKDIKQHISLTAQEVNLVFVAKITGVNEDGSYVATYQDGDKTVSVNIVLTASNILYPRTIGDSVLIYRISGKGLPSGELNSGDDNVG